MDWFKIIRNSVVLCVLNVLFYIYNYDIDDNINKSEVFISKLVIGYVSLCNEVEFIIWGVISLEVCRSSIFIRSLGFFLNF